MILLSSFTTWQPDQTSNSADDLLALLEPRTQGWPVAYCRQLPVDTDRAWTHLNQVLLTVQPQLLICCGMAVTRTQLCLETGATLNRKQRHCRLPLADWAAGLAGVVLSDDAGTFVCNALYHRALALPIPAAFIHVPYPAQGWEGALEQILRRALQPLQSF